MAYKNIGEFDLAFTDLKNAYNLTLQEKFKIDNLVKEEYSKQKRTIMEEPLGDILDKTFNFYGNFL